MIFLIDTHAFIWSILEPKNLSKKVKEIILDKNSEICVSTVSFWEISLKTRIKKFSFESISVNDFPKYARDMDFTIIEMKEQEAVTFHELPLKENHKDPFDRMLIWQSIIKNMIMISKDSSFEQYKRNNLKLIW
jgi:PIN domain nuclease of toxin-antitoxin system